MPTTWWVLAAIGVVALFVAYDAAVSGAVALAAAGMLTLACAVWLVAQSRLTVAVDEDGVHAGPALLPPWAIGTAEALDVAATRQARSAGADPHGFYLLRGYVGTSVRIWVDDPDDPVPYWLVSTRDPERVAQAAAAQRDRARSSP